MDVRVVEEDRHVGVLLRAHLLDHGPGAGRAAGVEVKVLPSFEQLLSGRVDLKPRTVSIQDLLRRDPVKLDMKGLHHWIDDKVLWVTGAAGSIGSEICRQLLQFELAA